MSRRRAPTGPAPTVPTIEGHRRGEPAPRGEPAAAPGFDLAAPRPGMIGDTISWHPDASAPAAGEPAQLVRRVGQFVLLERLGAGGMGVVFAAFDDKLERKVAIKLVATHGSDDRAQQRLLREAQSQARLSHPNVVTIYEVDALPEGALFIAMELVKGPTLRAWQDTRRTWRELVPIYAAAGEGLAAAHRGGVVHRDFKPDNVLLGDDGRVRVADFGLAFSAEAEPEPVTAPASTAPPSPAAPAASDSQGVRLGRKSPALTAAGAVVGTPGYMAPEQLTGAAVDARSDQFSFCVALYEALHGERPYADFAFTAATRPTPRRTEPDPAYPRWLWDVVMRGLAIDPAARFPSMDALLTELTRNRQRRRRRVIAGLGVLASLIAAAGLASAMTGHAPPPCPLATAELTGVWDAPTKQRAATALLATGTSFAAPMWTSTAAAFDRYAQRWIGAQQAACEATHVRHVQSAELLDRRMACLAERKRSLAAAADVLSSRPAQAVGHAGEILSSLGEIDLCADTGVLLELSARGAGAPNSVASARTQALTAEVRGRLARAGVLLATGDVAGPAAIVAEAATLATGLDDAIRAEVRYLEGLIKLVRGEVPESIVLFDRANALAVASHHDELIADIWIALAKNAGMRELKPADVEPWLAQAEAWLQRLGHASDPRRIEAEYARGNLQLTTGHARDALVTLTHALDAAAALWGPDDPRLIPLLRDRSTVEARLGQARPALADGERALALGIAAWGTDYPDIARTRRVLGLLYIEQLSDVPRGEHELTLALALYRAQLGADSIEVANCEQALSQAGLYRGDYAAALAHAERAEQIYAVRLGAESPRRGEALNGVGVLRFMRKDFAGSLAAYEAAYPILATAWGAGHATVGILLSNTGETLLELGRPEPAQTYFERSLAVLSRALDPNHADLALPLKGIGLAHLTRGQPREALAPLERALALRTQSPAASDPQELAAIRWGLARALRAVGRDAPRARELAEAARTAYRGLGAESADQVQAIGRWLATASDAPPR